MGPYKINLLEADQSFEKVQSFDVHLLAYQARVTRQKNLGIKDIGITTLIIVKAILL